MGGKAAGYYIHLMMQDTINELERIIRDFPESLRKADLARFEEKPSPQGWSKKEILGHLVDSAQNNIRRFIVSQYENAPAIGYAQDNWVAASSYQHWEMEDLVNLWTLLNKQVCAILSNPGFDPHRLCNTGELREAGWLATDYIKHLLHHVHQVLDLEDRPYP
jgi:hypothetical protein